MSTESSIDRRRFRRLRAALRGSRGLRRAAGQATVEFALTSFVFLAIVLGTIDFGRVIFTYSQLHNAVREGARVAKVNCTGTSAIKDAVIDRSPTLGLAPGDITVSTSGGCVPPDGKATVQATTTFTAVTQAFLGISPINLTSSATVDVE